MYSHVTFIMNVVSSVCGFIHSIMPVLSIFSSWSFFPLAIPCCQLCECVWLMSNDSLVVEKVSQTYVLVMSSMVVAVLFDRWRRVCSLHSMMRLLHSCVVPGSSVSQDWLSGRSSLLCLHAWSAKDLVHFFFTYLEINNQTDAKPRSTHSKIIPLPLNLAR